MPATTDRLLPEGQVNRFYQTDIFADQDTASSVELELFDSELPAGFTFTPANNEYRGTLNGRTATAGSQYFALQLKDQDGNLSYRQFQLTINEEPEPQLVPNPGPTPQPAPNCPPGYYYDDGLGYCVQEDISVNCPTGTYFNATMNTCVQYPQPPPLITCAPGYYFDPYSSQCLAAGYPRCPVNYSWDSYYQRCVRLPYSCPIGYKYSWSQLSCVPLWPQSCGPNQYWDPVANRCFNYHGYCAYKHWWDPSWHLPSVEAMVRSRLPLGRRPVRSEQSFLRTRLQIRRRKLCSASSRQDLRQLALTGLTASAFRT